MLYLPVKEVREMIEAVKPTSKQEKKNKNKMLGVIKNKKQGQGVFIEERIDTGGYWLALQSLVKSYKEVEMISKSIFYVNKKIVKV